MLHPLAAFRWVVPAVGVALLLLACNEEGHTGDAGDDSCVCDAGSDQPAPLELGADCATDAECASGHCVDRVCCHEACDQGCQTCAGARPGQCEVVDGPGCVVRVPDQASSLAEALARLGDGGVIEVTASLRESLVVDTDRALVIRGADGASPPTISSPTRDDVVIDLERAPAVRLENLAVTEGRIGVLVRGVASTELWGVTLADNGVGVRVDPPPESPSPSVHLLRCSLWNNHDTALRVAGGLVRVEEARFRGNRRGVEVSGGQGFELRRSLVAHSVGDVGVWVHDAERTVIADTFFWGNRGWAALLIDHSDQATVARSTFNGNAGAAIRVQRSTDVLLDRVRAIEQLDPREEAPDCEDPPVDLDTGELTVPGIDEMADCELAPEDVDYPVEDEHWMGNGLEIVDAQGVLVWNGHLVLNRGAGLLIDGSTDVWVLSGSMSLNARGGVTTRETRDLWISTVEATFNLVFGIQVIGGTAAVENSWVEWTGPSAAGTHGFGMSLQSGTIAVLNNDVLESHLAGIVTGGTPDARLSRISIDRNRIHGAPWGIVKNVGMLVDVGTNEITCEMTPTDCADRWMSMEPSPAPGPSLPLGLDEDGG